MRSYRVVVRGRFDGLSADAKAKLLAEADVHDMMQAQFTDEGTFTYDRSVHAFSFRYTLTDDADDPETADGNASTRAELNAAEYLDAHGYGYKDLRIECTNVEDMKAGTRRLQ